MFRTIFIVILVAGGLWCAETAKTPPKKTAFDKATMETYVRHLFVWGPTIKVDVGEPKPSPLTGFNEVKVHASAGQASADETLYVSKETSYRSSTQLRDSRGNRRHRDVQRF